MTHELAAQLRELEGETFEVAELADPAQDATAICSCACSTSSCTSTSCSGTCSTSCSCL